MTLLSRIARGATVTAGTVIASTVIAGVEHGSSPSRMLKLGDLVHGPRVSPLATVEPGSWDDAALGEGAVLEPASEPVLNSNLVDRVFSRANAAGAVPRASVLESSLMESPVMASPAVESQGPAVASVLESEATRPTSTAAEHASKAPTPSGASLAPLAAATQLPAPLQQAGAMSSIDAAASIQPTATLGITPALASATAEHVFDVGTPRSIPTHASDQGDASAPTPQASSHLTATPAAHRSELRAAPPASAINTVSADAQPQHAPATQAPQQRVMPQPAVLSRRSDAATATARVAAPPPATPPQPRVHIGSLEVIVEAPPAATPRSAAPLRGPSFASRHGLRGL